MTLHDWDRIENIFHDALEMEPADRTAFLDRACDGDADLRAEIAEMISAHGESGRLGVEDRLLGAVDPSGHVGRDIGPYRLEKLIGTGGMGDVYLARRSDEHYEQQVAFKLVREGIGTGSLAARFVQERQILARLEHPNIALLLDGGVTDGGRPYLVMQYVDGEPITEFCRRLDLSLPERLKLFRTVCRAVHAAHTNLVVHRDLKPANILVTSNGDVKLLDFGIAKLLDERAPESTLAMDRMLTPEHAAPEQITGEKVTTATDVYALGVLLYEMMTGTRPIAIGTSAPGEIERLIRETIPAPPSSQVPDRSTARAIRGDLDNICLMALRKEPERRYSSASDLAEDVTRHLEGRPVRAQRDTLVYRTGKFVRRNRWSVAAAAAFVLMSVISAGLILDQSRQANRERDRARDEQAKTERVIAILTGLLEEADPHRATGGISLTGDDFVERIDGAVDTLDEQPDVQARMRELLAAVHQAHSRFDEAEIQLQEALEYYGREPVDRPAVARVLHLQAKLIRQIQGPEAALPLLRESADRYRQLYGPNNPTTGQALQDLAGTLVHFDPDTAMIVLDEVIRITRRTPLPDPLRLAGISNQLGITYLTQGDHVRAAGSFERSLDLMIVPLGDSHAHVLTVTQNLAVCRNALGNWDEAEELQRQVLAGRIRLLGPDNLMVGRSWDSLGTTLAHQGRLDEADSAYTIAMAIFEETLGPESSDVSHVLRNLGSVRSLQERYEESILLLDRSLAIDRDRPEPSLRTMAHKRGNRSLARYAGGDRTAIAEARRALADIEAHAIGPQDYYRADLRTILATEFLRESGYGEAEALLTESLSIRALSSIETHPSLARDRCLLGAAIHATGRRREARELLVANLTSALSWGLLHPIQRDVIVSTASDLGLSVR